MTDSDRIEIFMNLLKDLDKMNPEERDSVLRSILVYYKYTLHDLYAPQEVIDYINSQKETKKKK